MSENNTVEEISDATMEEIETLISQADGFIDEGENRKALERFETALAKVPKPQEDYEAATWLLTAMGDTLFLEQDYEAALAALGRAVASAGGLGNPFVHLRLGQCHFELGNEKKAADELTRAYMGDAEQVFTDEHPKYLEFLKSQLVPAETN